MCRNTNTHSGDGQDKINKHTHECQHEGLYRLTHTVIFIYGRYASLSCPLMHPSKYTQQENKHTSKCHKLQKNHPNAALLLVTGRKGNIEAIKHFPPASTSCHCPSLSCCLRNTAVPNQKQLQKIHFRQQENSTF